MLLQTLKTNDTIIESFETEKDDQKEEEEISLDHLEKHVEEDPDKEYDPS